MVVLVVGDINEETVAILCLKRRAPLVQGLLLPVPWDGFLTRVPVRTSLVFLLHCYWSSLPKLHWQSWWLSDENHSVTLLMVTQVLAPVSSFHLTWALWPLCPSTPVPLPGTPSLCCLPICTSKGCLLLDAFSGLTCYMSSIAPCSVLMVFYICFKEHDMLFCNHLHVCSPSRLCISSHFRLTLPSLVTLIFPGPY